MIILNTTDNILESFLDNKFSYIAHGCDCLGILDDVDSLKLLDVIPGIWDRDLETKPTEDKLGTYSYLATQYGTVLNLYVYNRISGKNIVNLEALETVFRLLNDELEPGSTLALSIPGANFSPEYSLQIVSVIVTAAPDLLITIFYNQEHSFGALR